MVVLSCASQPTTLPLPPQDFRVIEHVILIIQENRSFDHYFGTFPGAEGIPMEDGVPTVCVPNPLTGECVQPHHESKDKNQGGPHSHRAALADIDGGRMDGFIEQQVSWLGEGAEKAQAKGIVGSVMGYHDDREIPNYWSYAREFVLQDHMFESVSSWTLPVHLSIVSLWSAKCSRCGSRRRC